MKATKLKLVATFCLVAGALGLGVALFFGVDLLTHWPSDYQGLQRDECYENLMHAIGLSLGTWAIDHHDRWPFQVSTNEGGTREYCDRDAEGFDNNSFRHFQVMSNELNSTACLVCPRDPSKKPAASFQALAASNVTYRLRSDPSVNEANGAEVLAVCPIDGSTLHCDGSVTPGTRRPPGPRVLDLWRYSAEFRQGTEQVLTSAAAALLLVLTGAWLRSKCKTTRS